MIYGGSLAACACAVTAATDAPGANIGMVIPYVSAEYGGLATAGGQNFWDVRLWDQDKDSGQQYKFPQAGSFARWYETTGHFYGTSDFARLLENEISRYGNIRTFWQTDVEAVIPSGTVGPTQVMLRQVIRGPEGFLRWGRDPGTLIAADTLVDASEDGRLARLMDAELTTGRADWPLPYLTADGTDSNLIPRQQAATVMFKVTGIKPGRYPDMTFVLDEDGTWGAYGGTQAYQSDPTIIEFNRTYGPQGFAIKPLNVAQNGTGSVQWWVNALVIFDVDGRANFRDRGTSDYPSNMRAGALETDRAWVRARRMLGKPEFLAALRRFDGFSQASIELYGDGLPEVGEVLYLREVDHALAEEPTPSAGFTGLEETAYAVTPKQAYLPGSQPHEGEDAGNYPTRVGLGFYWMDINCYRYEDLLDQNGGFQWPVLPSLRPDFPGTTPGPMRKPSNPMYLPFKVLIAPEVPNLLLPGTAANIASLAWAEIRVLPNQCVLGDAAGVAAAHAVRHSLRPAEFTPSDITTLQHSLAVNHGARLEK